MSTTPTAEEQLAQLEQDAIDGKAVKASDLSEARERVTLAGLFKKGADARAEKKRQAEAVEQRATAKAEVAALLDGHDDEQLEAYDAAVAALDHLAQVIEDQNARLSDAAKRLSHAQVPARYSSGASADGLDPSNFVYWREGGRVLAVTSEGVSRTMQDPGPWVRAAVHQVAEARGGLPLPSAGKLSQLVRGQAPDALKNRGE